VWSLRPTHAGFMESPAPNRLRVVARAVINFDVAEARRLAQAHLTRPGLTDLNRCPVQNPGTASLPNFMGPQGFHSFFVTEDRQFHKFIIIKMILTYPHDSVIR